jgi:2-C-methyl-D-erythritol 4-phosphate cytidylyltransferase
VVVAAPPSEVDTVTGRLRAAGITKLSAVVSGGDSRHASVRHALRAVPRSIGVVLVHDAVRPFVPSSAIQSVVAAVYEHGAAALAIPVADTLRRESDDGWFGDTVSRSRLVRMQTPQGFRHDWLAEAHRAAAASDAEPSTDDVDLVQRLGHAVRIVNGSPRNFKITTPGDWRLAQQLWADWSETRRS